MDYMSWIGVQYVVRYVFFFRFFCSEKWSTHSRIVGEAARIFQRGLRSRFSNELNFSKPPRTVPGINVIVSWQFCERDLFLWRDGVIENVSLFIGDLVTWGDEKVTTWITWWCVNDVQNLVANWSLPHFEEGLQPPVLRSVEAWRLMQADIGICQCFSWWVQVSWIIRETYMRHGEYLL